MNQRTQVLGRETTRITSGRIEILVLTLLGCSLIGSPVRGQETNSWVTLPATKLEAFETNIGTLIIKGTTPVGVVSANTGTVFVKAKEFTDTVTGQKQHGISVEIVRESLRDVMLIDDDELPSLLNAIDYLNKLDVSVSLLDSFDAAYTTKGGFRIAALGTRRTGLVQFGLRDVRLTAAPVMLSRDEMTRLSGLIDQAKKQLDGLRR